MVSQTGSAPAQAVDAAKIRAAIRDIPDFPKPGILFRDITTLLQDPALFQEVIQYFVQVCQGKNVDYVVGIESRGFILGAPLAHEIGAGFVPVRKKGKLPGPVERYEYQLEYGSDCVEVHKDAIPAGANVLIVDDLLATGGTAEASAILLKKLNVNLVGAAFLIELADLNGRDVLKDVSNIDVLITY